MNSTWSMIYTAIWSHCYTVVVLLLALSFLEGKDKVVGVQELTEGNYHVTEYHPCSECCAAITLFYLILATFLFPFSSQVKSEAQKSEVTIHGEGKSAVGNKLEWMWSSSSFH